MPKYGGSALPLAENGVDAIRSTLLPLLERRTWAREGESQGAIKSGAAVDVAGGDTGPGGNGREINGYDPLDSSPAVIQVVLRGVVGADCGA